MAELKFSIGVDDSKVEQAVQRMRQQFETISRNAVTSGKSIDDVVKRMVSAFEDGIDEFSTMSEQLEFQKQVVKDLGSELDKLGESLKEVTPSGEWETVDKSLQEAKQALVEWNEALAESEQEAMAADNANESLRSQLRKMQKELVDMEAAGKRGTREFRELQEQAGKLQDAIDDANKQMRIMANDQRGFQGIISGLSGVSGAMSAAMGVMGMFTDENEKMQKVMLKVQSLMSITVGLQQLQATLDKDSAFRLVTLNGLKEWWAKVTAQAAAAQTAENAAVATSGVVATGAAGGFKLLGAAIKSIPGLGWLLAAVSALGTIIALVVKRLGKEKELTGEMQRQKKLLDEIADAKSAAAKATQKDADALVIARDRLKTLQEGSSEWKRTVKDIADIIGVQADGLEKNIGKVRTLTDAYIKMKMAEKLGDEYLTRATNIKVDTEDVISKIGRLGKKDSDQAEELLSGLGLLSDGEIKRYIKAWKKSITDGSGEALAAYHDQQEWLRRQVGYEANKYVKLYEEQAKQLGRASLTFENYNNSEEQRRNSQESAKKAAENQRARIEAAKKAIEEGSAQLKDYEVSIQKEINKAMLDEMEDGTAKEIMQIQARHNERMAAIKEMEDAILEEERKIAKNQAIINGTDYNEESVKLTEEQRKMLETLRESALKESTNAYNAVINKQKKAYEELLRSYGDYTQRVKDITDKYNKQIADAMGDENLIARIRERMKKELDELEKEFDEISEEAKLFANALRGLEGELSDELIGKLKTLKDSLEGKDDKSSVFVFNEVNKLLEEQKTLFEQLDAAYNQYIDAFHAFESESSALNEANLAVAGEKYDQILKQLNADAMNIASTWFDAVKAIVQLSGELGSLHENQQEGLELVVGSLDTLWQGFQSGGPMGAIFSFLTSVLPKIVKYAEKLKNAAKEELKAHVDDLKAQQDRLQQLSSFWSNAASSGYGGYYEGLGGGDAYSNYMSNLDSVISNLRDQIESLKKIGSEAADDLQDAYIQLAEAVQEKFDAMVNDAERLIGITSSQMQSEVFDLSNASADDITKYFQQLIFDSYRMALTNTALATQTMSGTVEGFFSDLTLNIGNLMQRYIDAMFNGDQEAMDDVLRQLQYYLGDGYGTLSYTLTGIFGNIKDSLKEFADSLGLDYSALSGESTATSKGIAQASQESIDELNGRMTVIQAHTAQLLENSGLMRLDVASIRSIVGNIGDDTAAMRSMMSDMNTDLHYIRNNM